MDQVKNIFTFILEFIFAAKFSLRIFLILLSLFFAQLGNSFTTSILTSSFQGLNPHQKPIAIHIPSLQIGLSIDEAKIENNEWLITDKITAFYGENSAYPGFQGKTVIFAHARQGLFALLPSLQKDDEITLQTLTTTYTYHVSDKKIIDPNDILSITSYNSQEKNILVLFTCFGLHDTKRIVFFAPLTRISTLTTLKKQFTDI